MLLFTFVAAFFFIRSSIAGYVLEDDYTPSAFFSMFQFWTWSDPTHGFVNYIGQSAAQSSGLIKNNGNSVYIGVDHTNVASNGRSSIRLTSNKAYNAGSLVILDLQHMPGGICGTWPAFWMVGPNWPHGGEIDIIEGVHTQDTNDMTLHTGPGCSIKKTSAFSGSVLTSNCDINAAGQGTNAGCQIDTTNTNTYGAGFNAVGGGVYAMQWTTTAINIFFFQRGSIPTDIQSGNPNPAGWGLPLSQFAGNCDIPSFFQNNQIVFDTTFCGDWAGNTWSSSSCASKAATCDAFVANNPAAFEDAYWLVNSLRVYQQSNSVSDPNVITSTSVYAAATTASENYNTQSDYNTQSNDNTQSDYNTQSNDNSQTNNYNTQSNDNTQSSSQNYNTQNVVNTASNNDQSTNVVTVTSSAYNSQNIVTSQIPVVTSSVVQSSSQNVQSSSQTVQSSSQNVQSSSQDVSSNIVVTSSQVVSSAIVTSTAAADNSNNVNVSQDGSVTVGDDSSADQSSGDDDSDDNAGIHVGTDGSVYIGGSSTGTTSVVTKSVAKKHNDHSATVTISLQASSAQSGSTMSITSIFVTSATQIALATTTIDIPMNAVVIGNVVQEMSEPARHRRFAESSMLAEREADADANADAVLEIMKRAASSVVVVEGKAKLQSDTTSTEGDSEARPDYVKDKLHAEKTKRKRHVRHVGSHRRGGAWLH